ncbi:MAG: RNA ligase family protein [Planctomycetota bacterium]|nr:RNA ligase family protein [Planctomycetota bacterium]
MPQFYPLPRTPHCPLDSAVVDDDRVLTQAEFSPLVRDHVVIVQEKLDGTCCSFHYEGRWVLVLQKRAGLISSGEREVYNMFRLWAQQRIEWLYDIVGEEYVLFGEYVRVRHGVFYDLLPDEFVAFDLLHKATGRFLGFEEFLERLTGRLAVVPVLWQGPGIQLPPLPSLLGRSRFGHETAEGCYLRFEKDGRLCGRAKWRRSQVASAELRAGPGGLRQTAATEQAGTRGGSQPRAAIQEPLTTGTGERGLCELRAHSCSTRTGRPG